MKTKINWIIFVGLLLVVTVVFVLLLTNDNKERYFSAKTWTAVCNDDFNDTSKLAITCRVWGLLKYRHPNVTKGLINWDSVLIASLDKIINAETAKDLNHELFRLIKSAGNINPEIINKLKAKISVDSILNINLCWIKKSFLNDTIMEYLSQIGSLSVELPSYYVAKANENNTLIFPNEQNYNIDYIHDYRYRLLSLFRYWNVIYYFFPYKYQVDTPWDKTLYDFIPRFLNTDEVDQYRLTVGELATKINDGHGLLINNLKTEYSRIINLVSINDKIYIRKTSSESVLNRGDIICEIDEINIDEIVDSIGKYIPSSNIAYTKFKTCQLLGQFIEKAHSITIERKGHKLNFKSNIYVHPIEKQYSKSYGKLSETIGYVPLDKITESDIPEILEQFKSVEGIVLDLRCYPRNNAPYFLVSCFKDKSVSYFSAIIVNDLVHPGAFKLYFPEFPFKYKQKKYRGKLIVLVDESTMSAAEFTTMMFRAIGATIVGRPTAGADGNVAKFPLLGDIIACFSSIGIFYPDGSETQRIGILPDVEVYPDIQSILKDKDEILEAAINYINKNE
jgi:hypothetical protein